MPQFNIDDDAHGKIKTVKKHLKEKGINAPTNSDAIRYLYRQKFGYDADN